MNDSLRDVWTSVGGDASLIDACTISVAAPALPSTFHVSEAAAASVAAAQLAVAEFDVERSGGSMRAVHVDRRSASAAFISERLIRVDDAAPPNVWDPVAGDYRTADGWIRLHTNYSYHREAVARVLGAADDRATVAVAALRWDAVELESAVVAADGCAAAMRTLDVWRAHEQHHAIASMPVVEITPTSGRASSVRRLGPPSDPRRALAGLRVIDLTRVIAGPTCTRFLAAHGAEVLRVDPPGFAEVPALIFDVTAGKRLAFADLTDPEDRSRIEALIASADLVVQGYRPGALDRLGLAPEQLTERYPGLIVGRLSAWGDCGPWRERRGFDSLVQMAAGIAHEGMVAAGADRPTPLPAQALDHGSGYLLAAGVVRALTERERTGRGAVVRVALARTAQWLDSLGRDEASPAPLTEEETLAATIAVDGPLGRVRLARCPGEVEGLRVGWDSPPRPLGSDDLAVWLAETP
jgi:hypothetical protein